MLETAGGAFQTGDYYKAPDGPTPAICDANTTNFVEFCNADDTGEWKAVDSRFIMDIDDDPADPAIYSVESSKGFARFFIEDDNSKLDCGIFEICGKETNEITEIVISSDLNTINGPSAGDSFTSSAQENVKFFNHRKYRAWIGAQGLHIL